MMSDTTLPKLLNFPGGQIFLQLGRRLNRWGSPNAGEERFAWRHLSSCRHVLDVACGIGDFMSLRPQQTIGIDLNPCNIEYCRERGLDAHVGDALDLPFDANSFDGVHSAQVMFALDPGRATQYLSELLRVTRPGGTIVISNLCDVHDVFQYPEVARPYPPEALFRMIHAASSPNAELGTRLTGASLKAIRFRRPPLLNIRLAGSERAWHLSTVLNALQYGCGLRKFWTMQGYTVVLTKNSNS